MLLTQNCLLQVVDGTTIYFDDPPPKINEAPSLDNTTPEAISPSVSLARGAQPTDSVPDNKDAPEIESSVREDLDQKIESEGTAALSDNPGVAQTANDENSLPPEIEVTDPASVVEEIQTASPGHQPHHHTPEGQADHKQEKQEEHEAPEEITTNDTKPEDYETDNDEEIQSEDYIEDLTEEQKAKLQDTINRLKAGEGSNDQAEIDQPGTDELARPDDDGGEVREEITNGDESIPAQTLDEDSKKADPEGEKSSENVEIKEEPLEAVKDADSKVEADTISESVEENIEGEIEEDEKATLEITETEETTGPPEETQETQEILPDITNQALHHQEPQHQQEHQRGPEDSDQLEKQVDDQHLPSQEVHDEHGHSHELGDLGQEVLEKVPEEVPEFFQPAEQKLDVPLSQQFPDPSEQVTETYEVTTQASLETDHHYQEVHTPAFETTTTPTTDYSQHEASQTVNEATEEEPSSGGLFSSLTNMLGSSTESGPANTQEEGQTNALFILYHISSVDTILIFCFQHRNYFSSLYICCQLCFCLNLMNILLF